MKGSNLIGSFFLRAKTRGPRDDPKSICTPVQFELTNWVPGIYLGHEGVGLVVQFDFIPGDPGTAGSALVSNQRAGFKSARYLDLCFLCSL